MIMAKSILPYDLQRAMILMRYSVQKKPPFGTNGTDYKDKYARTNIQAYFHANQGLLCLLYLKCFCNMWVKWLQMAYFSLCYDATP